MRAKQRTLPTADGRQLPKDQQPGSWLEKAEIQTAVLVPKRGPVLARLGNPPGELGDHDIILGRPFLSHMAARVEGDDCWIPTLKGQRPYPNE